MNAKHTPGPWHAEPFDDENEVAPAKWAVWHYSGGSGCTVAERIGRGANAHLIAAAPDLLAALRAIEMESSCAVHGGDVRFLMVANMARAALAKATGSA